MSGFHAKKALGQNFISDQGIISAIADASCAGPSDTIVEIGPGLGALTCELAERAAKVYAVELDTSVIPLLKGNLAGAQNVEVINEDILKFDWSRALPGFRPSESASPAQEIAGSPRPDLCKCGQSVAGLAGFGHDNRDSQSFAENERPQLINDSSLNSSNIDSSGVLRIVGNLPYYITTPILLGILEKNVPAESITVMVQKEVADRITASPGGKDYGVLSISLQYYAECEKVLDVPSEYFTPRPKVDSAVVHMTLKRERLLTSEEEPQFFALVKTAFSQRRKTLLNSLTGFGGFSKELVSELLISAGIDPQRRPETLSIEEFAALSRSFTLL